MKKSNQSEPEKEPKSDRWLLTYSDMITLLLGLFIILYSMSNIEMEKLKAIAQAFSSVFKTAGTTENVSSDASASEIDYDAVLANLAASASGAAASGTEDGGSGTGTPGSEEGGSGTGSGAAQSGAVITGPVTPENSLDQIYQALSQYIEKSDLQNEIALTKADNSVCIHMKDVLMFQPDTAELLSSSRPMLQEVGLALVKVYDCVDQITIGGHTADVGEHTTMTDEVSWELSLSRADEVRKSFVDLGLKEDKVSIAGYAHYRPIASNETEAGRAQNRRVEITIYKYSDGTGSSSDAPAASGTP